MTAQGATGAICLLIISRVKAATGITAKRIECAFDTGRLARERWSAYVHVEFGKTRFSSTAYGETVHAALRKLAEQVAK